MAQLRQGTGAGTGTPCVEVGGKRAVGGCTVFPQGTVQLSDVDGVNLSALKHADVATSLRLVDSRHCTARGCVVVPDLA